MNSRKLACALGAILSVAVIATSAQADVAKTYHNPKIGSKRLDGCYSWPGKCRTKQQADAFCKMQGYQFATAFDTSNEFGAYQTKRLGDGGVCTASCTVMVWVTCDFGGGE